jgi:hypothetical protein
LIFGEVLCFLCGTDWIPKYYLDDLRLQRVSTPALWEPSSIPELGTGLSEAFSTSF